MASASSGKRQLMTYTAMLLAGLTLSQLAAAKMSYAAYSQYGKIVGVATMFCLSFLMVHVGNEFVIEKSDIKGYAKDYAIAMSAAGLPWIFVACWLVYALPGSMAWGPALLMARFAAPTSAGILFSMLEAAGFKETWLFQKARVLAIFDDLDTILLMIPLKMFLVGFKWELAFDAVFVSCCLGLAWRKLHRIRLPSSWNWTMLYAALVTAVCEGMYFLTNGRVHVEVLLPAFALGCMTRICMPDDTWCEVLDEEKEGQVKNFVSTGFMLLVGLSMPSLFSTGGAQMSSLAIAGHVLAVSILMVLGKMMLLFCYKDEADLRTRLALSLGMCPRGEVGAGVIAISLGLGMRGTPVTIAVLSLAVNLLLSSGFIMAIDHLMRSQRPRAAEPSTSSSSASSSMAALGSSSADASGQHDAWFLLARRHTPGAARLAGAKSSPKITSARLRSSPPRSPWFFSSSSRAAGMNARYMRPMVSSSSFGCFVAGLRPLTFQRSIDATAPRQLESSADHAVRCAVAAVSIIGFRRLLKKL
eukprot:TRINITY_DN8879_c0_g1_i1.p1 TRINITY_DN8879_c0_g1~~TRINITY_DN8879_c0_g1_i1.p1  ORF type:complete len:569 (+),score=97.03 TRINITY_DN8879_c0_g1_i1:123-1709(+)